MVEPSELWDRWREARRADTRLTPQAFVAALADADEEVLDLLHTLIEVDQGIGPSALVDIQAPPGDSVVFAGFRLDRPLGQGSSGIVWLARDERPGSEGGVVALKVLNPLLGADPRRRASILRELRIAERLRHPGIVPVLAGGTERGYPWVASEYVEGETLDRVLTHIPAAERARRALEIGIELAEALAHAHEQGVVHRDLKPGNVIVDPVGRARVLDFGLAHAEGAALAISRTGDVVGTPLYMAPEQARGEREVGPAADVYALGMLLYDVARGEARQPDLPLSSLLARIASGRMRPRGAEMRELPRALREIVSRCTEAHPKDRYPSARELLEDLHAARTGSALPHGAWGQITRRVRQARRHPVRAVAAATSAALLALAGWYAWWTWPVPVFFQEVQGGKVLWIDGREVGTTPIALSLRPGQHTWRASFKGESNYEGTFEVRPRERQFVLLALEPPQETPILSPPFEFTGGQWAWVFIATPYPGLRIDVDGHPLDAPLGLCAFQLPFGTHEVGLHIDGRKDVRRTLNIRDQTLHSVLADPDPIGSPWTTITLYSPLDELVRNAVVQEQGLRLYYEKQRVQSRGYAVERAYWGPAESYEDGSVLLRLPLLVPPEDLRLALVPASLAVGEGSWSRLEIGRAPGHMVTILECRAERRVTECHVIHDERMASFTCEPDESIRRALLENLRGARDLWLRWSVGGVPAGGSDSALAQALRCNAFPCITPDGVLTWGPSVKLAVRSGERQR